MDTKKAIEKISDKYEGWMGYARTQKEVNRLGKERDEIIELLQCGEEYEAMWGEFKKDIARASIENWKVSAERFVLEMRKLEQKYFPKGSG